VSRTPAALDHPSRFLRFFEVGDSELVGDEVHAPDTVPGGRRAPLLAMRGRRVSPRSLPPKRQAFLGGTVNLLAHLVELGLDLRHALHLHLELRVDALDLFLKVREHDARNGQGP
jgi:hypothetical protein